MTTPGPQLRKQDSGLRRWEVRVPAGQFIKRFWSAGGATRWLRRSGWGRAGFAPGSIVRRPATGTQYRVLRTLPCGPVHRSHRVALVALVGNEREHRVPVAELELIAAWSPPVRR